MINVNLFITLLYLQTKLMRKKKKENSFYFIKMI
jgi:hypothetical protein